MKYSIIITYRDREEHLKKLLPRLEERFKGTEYEIIISEQLSDGKFRKNTLYNIAGDYAKGDTLIFHDVDHYPSDNVSYDVVDNKPTYPVRNVVFLDKDDQPVGRMHVPLGYNNFHIDVGDHSGGVFILSREHWNTMKGLNSMYVGWGKEDDDTRARARHKLQTDWHRNKDGKFYAFHHEDNKPLDTDPDFINNEKLLHEGGQYADVDFRIEDSKEQFDIHNNGRIVWIKVHI
jgi:hypothetical protein